VVSAVRNLDKPRGHRAALAAAIAAVEDFGKALSQRGQKLQPNDYLLA
jgi:hypothetical protein